MADVSKQKQKEIDFTSLWTRNLVDDRTEEVSIWTIFILRIKKVIETINVLLDAQLAVAVDVHCLESLLCPRRVFCSELDKYSVEFVLLQVTVTVYVHQVEKAVEMVVA